MSARREPSRPGGATHMDQPLITTVALPSRPSLLNARTLCGLGFLGALVWSLWRAGLFSAPDDIVNPGGWSLVQRFVAAGIRPELSSSALTLTLHSALVTWSFALCGTALAVLFGAVAGVLASQTWWRLSTPALPQLPWLLTRGVLALPRSIHEAVWGVLLIKVLGLDPLVAVLAIAIPYGAITAKVFSEILDETPHDALHALHAAGVSPFKSLLYGLLPQAFPALLSYSLYRLECALRAAVILGLIGAGGLGFQIRLSLQSLRFEQVWTFLYALIFLVGITDAASALCNHVLHIARQTEVRVEPRHQEEFSDSAQTVTARGQGANITGLVATAVIITLVLLAFRHIGADFRTLWAERALKLFAQSTDAMFPPRLNAPLLADLTALSLDTLAMSILAISLAGAVGLVASVPAATNLMLPSFRSLAFGATSCGSTLVGAIVLMLTRSALLVARALSEALWALLVLFVLFPGIVPGAVALGLYNAGVLGRLMAEVNENAPDAPRRSLATQGASGITGIFYALLPQTLPRHLAYVLYRWEVCIRATAVVGLVGAGGLGRRLSEQLTSFNFPAVMTTLLFFLALTFLVDLISTGVRRVVR